MANLLIWSLCLLAMMVGIDSVTLTPLEVCLLWVVFSLITWIWIIYFIERKFAKNLQVIKEDVDTSIVSLKLDLEVVIGLAQEVVSCLESNPRQVYDVRLSRAISNLKSWFWAMKVS